MLLLAVLAGARPVVLAPLALHDALRDTRRGAPGTLNAGRGARARRARRRVLRPRDRKTCRCYADVVYRNVPVAAERARAMLGSASTIAQLVGMSRIQVYNKVYETDSD